MQGLLNDLADLARTHPSLLVFLALGLGYYLGAIKVRGFSLGATTSVLLVAIALGQLRVEVPQLLETVAFALFIFTIGYKVGPQFIGGLKKEGLNYIWVSMVVAFVGLGTALIMAKMLGFGPGTTAGLIGGAMTQSATIGTAQGAIQHLDIPAAAKAAMQADTAAAYAITYIFGTAGLIVALKLAPRFLRINLQEEANKLERQMAGNDAGQESPDMFAWRKRLHLRAYRVTNEDLVGKTVADLERHFRSEVAVDEIERRGKVFDPAPEMELHLHDHLALVGAGSMVRAETLIGPEIEATWVADQVGEILDVVALSPEAVGKTLGEISDVYGERCFLWHIRRQGHELPLTRGTVVERCDVLRVAGSKEEVERFVKHVGFAERTSVTSDLVFMGLGIVVGTLLGLIAVPLAGIPITLGVGGGVLVSGLLFGWLRSLHPTFGRIPDAAQWVFTDLGLNLFIASVGLGAGPRAIAALQTTGLPLFLAGVAVTLLPMIAGLSFGRLVLKMNPVLLIGALTGAETCTAALNAMKEDADSAAPVLGYTVPYAFGNVLLTVWGTIAVNVIHRIG